MQFPMPTDPPNTTFTVRERARLVAYKAAIAAGFFMDSVDATPRPHGEPQKSADVCVSGFPAAYPFTQAELARLALYKRAVQAGLYSDV